MRKKQALPARENWSGRAQALMLKLISGFMRGMG